MAHSPAAGKTSYLDGRQRLGHFELIEQVGIGGFGAVWKARDTVLDRVVALKIPRRSHLDAADVEYFLRDARAAAQLRHPHIVSVHEIGRDGDIVVLASDFIDGANLKDWLSARPMTVREAAEFVAEIADAVQHAHERGVVHRDLKPGNILIDHDDRPHLTDFGLAKRETGEITITVDGQILGTPAYMSPEQARGKSHEADAVSDVYSLGVILFELLTGELPFRGDKRMLLLQILNDEPPSPRKLNGRVPRDLETICLKCLQKEPKRRFAGAKTLSEDLRRFLRGETVLARPIGRVERTRRLIKRHPAVAMMSVLIAAITLFGLATTTWLWRRAEESLARSESRRYANQIALAKFEIEGDELERGNAILKQCRSDLQGWEWTYLKRRASPFLSIWRDYRDRRTPPNDIALSSDGKWLVTAHTENVAVIWDALTGLVLQTFTHHRPVRSVCLSADSQLLVTTSGSDMDSKEDDGLVTVWNTRTGEKVRTRNQYGGSNIVTITADGSRVVSLDRGRSIVIWRTSDGALVTQFPADSRPPIDVAISPDGHQIAVMNEGFQVKLLNAVNGQTTAELSADGENLIYGGGRGMVFSASGRTFAATHGIWDAQSGSRVSHRTGGGHVDVAYSPLRDEFVFLEHLPVPGGTGADRSILAFLGASDGALHATVKIRDYPNRVAISRDGQKAVLVGGGLGERVQTVSLLDAWLGHNPLLFEVLAKSEVPVGEITPSSTGRYLVVHSRLKQPKDRRQIDHDQPSALTIFSAETGRVALRLEPGRGEAYRSGASAWHPGRDALAVAEADNAVRIWNVQKREIESELPNFGSPIRAIAWNPTNAEIAVVGANQDAAVFDATNRKIVRRLSSDSRYLNSTAWSPDGTKLAAQGDDGVVYLWHFHTDETVERFTPGIDSLRGAPGEQFSVLRWSPDSRRLAVGSDQFSPSPRISVIDVSRPEKRSGVMETAARSTDFAWQPVTCNIASSTRGPIELFDAQTEKVLWKLTDPLQRFVFSPDGRRMVGTRGSNIVVYDAGTADELISMRESNQQITALAFDKTGEMLFAAYQDGAVRVYNGKPLRRTSSAPVGLAAISNRAPIVLTGEVFSGGSTDGKVFMLSVRVESIQKDETAEFAPGDVVTIQCQGPAMPKESGTRARFYLASKSNDVWTTVSPGDSIVVLEDALSR